VTATTTATITSATHLKVAMSRFMSRMMPQSRNRVCPMGTIHRPGTHLNLSAALHSAVCTTTTTTAHYYYTLLQQQQTLLLHTTTTTTNTTTTHYYNNYNNPPARNTLDLVLHTALRCVYNNTNVHHLTITTRNYYYTLLLYYTLPLLLLLLPPLLSSALPRLCNTVRQSQNITQWLSDKRTCCCCPSKHHTMFMFTSTLQDHATCHVTYGAIRTCFD